MQNRYIIKMKDDDLYHHGILGQKWGIRRFQNKDGSRTPAGRKRYDGDSDDESKSHVSSLAEKPKPVDRPIVNKKSVSKMSDEDLDKALTRYNKEKMLLDYQKNILDANSKISSLTPKQVSLGERFVNHALDKVIVPAATDASKAWLTQTLKDKMGVKSGKKDKKEKEK